MSPKAVITTKNLTPKTLLHPDRTVTNCGSEWNISCHFFWAFSQNYVSDFGWLLNFLDKFGLRTVQNLWTALTRHISCIKNCTRKIKRCYFQALQMCLTRATKNSGALVRSVLVVLNVILWLDLLWFTMQEQSHKKEEANFSKNVHFLILRILLFKESVWYRAGQVRMQKHNLFFHYSVVLCGSSVWQHFVQ